MLVKAFLLLIGGVVLFVAGSAVGTALSENDSPRAESAGTARLARTVNPAEAQLFANAVGCTLVPLDSPCPLVSEIERVGPHLWRFRVTTQRAGVICFTLDSRAISVDLRPPTVHGVARTPCT